MITVTGLTKTFVKEGAGGSLSIVHALDAIDLTIRDGEFVCLIGPSGCGKTTLLKMIDGLVPFDGEAIRIDGQPVVGPGPDRAMVFQSFALLPWRDAKANVTLALEARGLGKAEREARASEALAAVGLSAFEHHHPHELSGGMQQRVGLARALAVEPRILLMDEPFGALDEQTRRVLQDDLIALWERLRQTVVFVTHSMDEAVYLADRVVVMSPRPGRIREVIDVDLPRPRSAATRDTSRFGELVSYVWDRLREYNAVGADLKST